MYGDGEWRYNCARGPVTRASLGPSRIGVSTQRIVDGLLGCFGASRRFSPVGLARLTARGRAGESSAASQIGTTCSGAIVSLKLRPGTMPASAGDRFCRATTISTPSPVRQL